jgi:hypothetical protein
MWDQFAPDDWRKFAVAWIAELNGAKAADGEDIGQRVVLMNFTATPAQQWSFLRAAVGVARSEDDLSAIAAGPLEHLLAKHGADYIADVEREAQESRPFARAVAGVWRNTMSDDVWLRVQAIQKTVGVA